jgi:dephospho-CoA kinase
MKIGLTGNIAAGKSTVAKMLEKRGAYILDADTIAHNLYQSNPKLIAQITTEFGDKVLDTDGKVNRKKLGQIVFSHKSKLETLNKIVHPIIRKEILTQVDLKSANHQTVVLEAALLFENNFLDYWDKVFLVTASDELRKQRLLAKGLSNKEALERISSQMPQEQKVPMADVVLENNGSCHTLWNQILDLGIV